MARSSEVTLLQPFTEGIWLSSQPQRIVGMQLTSTMAVLLLGNQKLLLYSPVQMTAERRAAVEALGTVAHLYAPNLFHHLHIGEWSAAFPSARVHAPRGMAKKRPDLRIDRVHGETSEPDFIGIVEEAPIEGFRLNETVLVCAPARTLLVADLVHNVGRPTAAWARFYTRTTGFYDRVALSRVIRWTAFADRMQAARSVERILSLDFERLVVGHGTPLTSGAKEALRCALEWLPKSER